MIDQWEQSGQGDGGRAADSSGDDLRPSGWGSLEGRTQEALDSRANFLNGSPSWYLYFWELADEYQLLGSTLQRLKENVGTSTAKPSASVSRLRQKSDKVGMDISISRSSSDSVDASSSIHGMIQKLIDSGEEDRQHERELRKRELEFHIDEQRHAEELHLKKRIFDVSDAIDNYQIQFALTEKSVFGQLIARKQEELSKLQAELEGVKRSRVEKTD